MAEMTAVEYLKEKARMGKVNKRGLCTANCEDCKLSNYNNGTKLWCKYFESSQPEEAVSIVQKWAEEHPAKTMLQDFFEKHPNAPRKTSGDPIICIVTLGYKQKDEVYCDNCFDCWNRPLEDNDEQPSNQKRQRKTTP